jgi:hypothetical protein
MSRGEVEKGKQIFLNITRMDIDQIKAPSTL